MTEINDAIKKYLDDLAARVPAPGGGSSAALAGAMASALTSMALNFTLEKDEYRDFAGSAKEALVKSEALRAKFMKCFEDDVKSYTAVSGAYTLPKDSDSNKLKRNRTIKEAFREATLVPLHICQYSVDGIKMVPEIAKRGNKKLICDMEVAVRMFEAAFYSARINVVVNQKNIDDEEFNKDVTGQLGSLEKDLIKFKESSEKEIAVIIGR